VDELRKLQKVGYSTLSISIPKDLVDKHHLKGGDSLLFREDVDGTMRLIPNTGDKGRSKTTIKASEIEDPALLSRLVIGAYDLGYDVIEVVGKNELDHSTVERLGETIRRLKGLEAVDVQRDRVVAQSFIDPTKFPVDSLIRRVRILVSRSMDVVIEALDPATANPSQLDEVRKTQEEVHELYWLIIRQLLVALNRREMASEIGIDSPLHASGDRVVTKALDEVEKIVLEMSQELARMKGKGVTLDKDVLDEIKQLAAATRNAFNITTESFQTPDIKQIKEAVRLTNEALELEKSVTSELLELEDYGYARVLVSYLGQIARYCNVVMEITIHRLLRKSSRVATIQPL
jgi:phosphate uptake regulator